MTQYLEELSSSGGAADRGHVPLPPGTQANEVIRALARRLRRASVIATAEAGSGHPTSCLSCADLIAVLFYKFLRFHVQEPGDPRNDRFILSKGHAAPILWAAWAEAGAFPRSRITELRKFESELEGHPTPRCDWVDVATGSLGQGLANGVGMAWASRVSGILNTVYVLLGDGETQEGAVWEAAALAGHYRLRGVTAIVDVNRLGQSAPTMLQHSLDVIARRFEAFGWHAAVVDGHNIEQIAHALHTARYNGEQPYAIIAKTIKGKGVSFLEDEEGRHGKPLEGDELKQALAELGEADKPDGPIQLARPQGLQQEALHRHAVVRPDAMPPIERDYAEDTATRQAFGSALRRLGSASPLIAALDGDVQNSTYVEEFSGEYPDRFFQCYIGEQAMVGAAVGMAAMGRIPFAATFACFLTRAFDQIRMAGISRANIKLCGSHCGVSIGEDGPSQMGLEDLAMMRSQPNATVLYPSDAISTERAVELAAATPGLVYIRTTRPKTPPLYSSEETFEVGGMKVWGESEDDAAVIVGAGITVHEALAAQKELAELGVKVRVVDLYSIKPLDAEGLQRAALETGIVVTVEDHYPGGGLGEAVCSVLRGSDAIISCLAVHDVARSGSKDELLDAFGISTRCIKNEVFRLLG